MVIYVNDDQSIYKRWIVYTNLIIFKLFTMNDK